MVGVKRETSTSEKLTSERWLASEVAYHVEIYQSKVAEDFAAFVALVFTMRPKIATIFIMTPIRSCLSGIDLILSLYSNMPMFVTVDPYYKLYKLLI